LRQNGEQGCLAQVRGFPSHIGTRNDQDLVAGVVQIKIIRNEFAGGQLIGKLFDDSVTSLSDNALAFVGQLWAHVAPGMRYLGQGDQAIEL
jgi:hypothetical protein